MRASTLCGLTTFAVLSFALPVWSQVAGGQSTAPNSTTAHSGPEPYTAEFKITTVKTLANGTTIAQDFTEVQAWDAHGRTMTAMTTVPASSNQTALTKVRVFDPVTRTGFSWDSRSKLATVIKGPLPQPGRPSCGLTTPENVSVGSTTNGQPSGKLSLAVGAPTGLSATVSAVSEPMHVKTNTSIEHLGTETIQGFEAHGSRVTQTIPAGAIGNREPLVNTRESWQANAHGIGLTVREVDDDPQNGKRTMELVNFSLGEPDPASFQPPEGYEILNQETQQIPCQR